MPEQKKTALREVRRKMALRDWYLRLTVEEADTLREMFCTLWDEEPRE